MPSPSAPEGAPGGGGGGFRSAIAERHVRTSIRVPAVCLEAPPFFQLPVVVERGLRPSRSIPGWQTALFVAVWKLLPSSSGGGEGASPHAFDSRLADEGFCCCLEAPLFLPPMVVERGLRRSRSIPGWPTKVFVDVWNSPPSRQGGGRWAPPPAAAGRAALAGAGGSARHKGCVLFTASRAGRRAERGGEGGITGAHAC